MSRRGRAAIKSIVLDDSDDQEEENKKKKNGGVVGVPGKLSFSRPSDSKNIKSDSTKLPKSSLKSSNELPVSATLDCTGEPGSVGTLTLLSGSPNAKIAAIDLSGDDILGFDTFAKSNKALSHDRDAQDPELSAEVFLQDELSSKPTKRRRLRKGERSNSSPSRSASRKAGSSPVDQDDDDDDFQPVEATDDEPIVPQQSKKRQRPTEKPSGGQTENQLDFVSLPRLPTAPKGLNTGAAASSTSKKQTSIVSTFQKMLAQKNSSSAVKASPLQKSPSDDDIIIVESISPSFQALIHPKSSSNTVAASPKRKFAVSRLGATSPSPSEPDSTPAPSSFENSKTSAGGLIDGESIVGISGEMWTAKYAPQSREDLAVPPKKVQEFADLLIQAIQDSRIPVLLGDFDRRLKMIIVQGPPGSGKTATLRILAKSLSELSGAPTSFNYLEWHNQVVSRAAYGLDSHSSQQYEQPLLDSFFMWLAGRREAGVLPFESPDAIPHSYISNEQDLPLLVVEDMPNVFTLQQKQKFQAEIRASLATNPYKPVVWIVSDDAGGQSPVRTLFGEDFVTSVHVKSVTFRPVTKRNMLNALKRIVETEKLSGSISDADLNAIVEISDGDLRSAINSLQWLATSNSSAPESSKSKSKSRLSSKKSNSKSNTASTVRALMNRDSSLSLFHAVGKVLFNKRLDINGEETTAGIHSLRSQFDATSNGESTRSPYWRPRLKSKPEYIMDNFIHTESDMFTLFLHENYLSFLGNGSSLSSESLESCADYWSVSDIIQATSATSATPGLKLAQFNYSSFSGQSSVQNQQQKSNIPISRESAALVAMYGTVYSNTADTPRGKDVSRFKKSRLNQTTQRQRENARLMSSLLRLRIERSTVAQSEIPIVPLSAAVSIRDAATQMLPFMHRIETRSSNGSSSESFIKLMCWYSIDSKTVAALGRDQSIDSNFRETLDELETEGDAIEKSRAQSLEANFSRELYDKLHAELATTSRDLKNARAKLTAVAVDEDDPIQND